MDKGNRRAGFTLLEMVVVLAMLAILLALIVPNVAGYLGDAFITACQANRRAILNLYDLERMAGTGATLDELVRNEGHAYFSSNLACPRGGTYSATEEGDGSYVIRCSVHDDVTQVEYPTDPKHPTPYPYCKYFYGTKLPDSYHLTATASPEKDGHYLHGILLEYRQDADGKYRGIVMQIDKGPDGPNLYIGGFEGSKADIYGSNSTYAGKQQRPAIPEGVDMSGPIQFDVDVEDLGGGKIRLSVSLNGIPVPLDNDVFTGAPDGLDAVSGLRKVDSFDGLTITY